MLEVHVAERQVAQRARDLRRRARLAERRFRRRRDVHRRGEIGQLRRFRVGVELQRDEVRDPRLALEVRVQQRTLMASRPRSSA